MPLRRPDRSPHTLSFQIVIEADPWSVDRNALFTNAVACQKDGVVDFKIERLITLFRCAVSRVSLSIHHVNAQIPVHDYRRYASCVSARTLLKCTQPQPPHLIRNSITYSLFIVPHSSTYGISTLQDAALYPARLRVSNLCDTHYTAPPLVPL